jgi:hypothetical protein
MHLETAAPLGAAGRRHVARLRRQWLLFSAPAVALAAGLAAEWLDFRALRYPLLLSVLVGVLATSLALSARTRPRIRDAMITVAIGVATWGAAETIYVVIHTLRGEAFHAERFGPQWSQAFGLIAVHAFALGAPTGVAAALLQRVVQSRMRV